ncbi:tyrosine-type recombinase/integrase [uncultured Bradyrhizobium sp.]|jgi:integrase|uniref:tyrosine-type recombinase/integrase n=1 Tax=uncultured Bradyrhizobium sp. TaxID=199684 RepID=UPI00262E8885|nr:tyrosine-type recombinase/integrase [uncultured Bradyrhizobium sp.]
MPDFLTRRHNTWHFVRRVPIEYAALDPRRIIKHSTKVRIAEDRAGRRATRVAMKLNEELEAYWRTLSEGKSKSKSDAYDEAKRRARALGLDFLDNSQIVVMPLAGQVERVETLVGKGGMKDDGVTAAVLGTQQRPVLMLSEIFREYEAVTKDEVQDYSPHQLRIWRNARDRAVKRFVDLIGDKPVTQLTDEDAMTYTDDWRDRVVAGEVTAKTANRDIGQLSGMLKTLNRRRRLKLRNLFEGLKLRNEIERSRKPFDPEFIQKKLLATGALDELNEDARHIFYIMVETGLRLSEIANLRAKTIHLDAKIPYVSVEADERRLKTKDSQREIPLVGVALMAMRKHPDGFRRYRDNTSSLSANVNKYLKNHGLRPSPQNTVYSLRHSFKDRLVAAEVQDSMIDALMGHKPRGSKYGDGPTLSLKLKVLEQIAFKPPSRV